MVASDEDKVFHAAVAASLGLDLVDEPAPGSRLARFLAVDDPAEAYLLARVLVAEVLAEQTED